MLFQHKALNRASDDCSELLFIRVSRYTRHWSESFLMAPVIVLAITLVLARLLGKWRFASLNSWPAATRVGLAVMFCFTAIAHFNAMRSDLANMVPPWVPNPPLMVLLTGICELAGAIGLLIPKTRRVAAVALVLFLIAVFPANVHAAQAGVTIRGEPVTSLLPRTLMQLLFITLVFWSGIVAGSPATSRR
jgi:uncharacterized membrane protein